MYHPKHFTQTLVIAAGVVMVHGSMTPSQAQIRADQTLPQRTVVRTVGNRHLIEDGTQAGTNLFHSFEQFSVPDGQTASFQNAPQISNILSRVTGGSPSSIRGVLEAQGTANLYLLNPNGVLFGPNAELRLGGSFLATTAESFIFQDGTTFSTLNPGGSTLLSVTAPIGVQFGAQPGQIDVLGRGNQLFVDFPFIEEASPPQALEVAPAQTLALLGGDLSLDGGNLRGIDGYLELGAVKSADVVRLSEKNGKIQGNYDSVRQFGNIRLRNAASVNTSGNGSGSITVQGGQVRLSGGSTLLARTLGNGGGRGIRVIASDLLELRGFSEDAFGPAFPTSLLTDVAVFGNAAGQDITIRTPNLRVLDGAFISAGTFDLGDAGTVKVVADRIELRGDGPFGASGLFSDTFAPGSGGKVDLKTGVLRITDGAQISTSTLPGSPLGTGLGGSQTIIAEEIELAGGSFNSGSSGLFANVETDRAGGTIDVQTNRLAIVDGAQIATSSFGPGTAGDIRVRVDQAQLAGTSPNGVSSGIFSNAEATGDGGRIRLQGLTTARIQRLQVTGGAQIASSTFDAGQAGSIFIEAQETQLLGAQTPVGKTTGIIAAVEPQAIGMGGTVTLTGEQLTVQDGAQISVGTRGPGNAGDLRVNVQNIELNGGDRFGRSGLFVSALESTGTSGNLTVQARNVTLDNGATINASNFPSRVGAGLPGSGAAGNIGVQAQTIRLKNQSQISAETAAGDRGNINLSSNLLQLTQGSQISTNAQGPAIGGNINLNHNFIFASGNSDITANAQQNFGGRVTIQAQSIFGTEFREQLTPLSDISASSDLGPAFSGIVQINSPETDPSDSLVNLPEVVVNRSQQVQNTCRQNAGNSLVVSQPQSLSNSQLNSHAAAQSWFQRLGSQAAAPDTISQLAKFSEAQGWTLNEQGRLKLISSESKSLRGGYKNPTC